MFTVESDEIGYPSWSPCHKTEDQEEAEMVCSIMAEKHKCRCVVVKKGRSIFLVDFSGRFFKKSP
jgi:hypothetical protein